VGVAFLSGNYLVSAQTTPRSSSHSARSVLAHRLSFFPVSITSGLCQYEVQVTVNGVACSTSPYAPDAQYHYCPLPDFDFDPSVAYDVVAYNDAGKQTLSGLVRYSDAPTIVSIDECVDRGEFYASIGVGVRCLVGTTITLRGARFPAADAVTVQYTTNSYSANVTLLNPNLVNSSTITATLPTLDAASAAAVYGQFGSVRAVFTSAGVNTTTNIVYNRIYIAPDAPSVTSITSTMCDTVSPLQLTNCRAMAAITVMGTNLARNDLQLLTSLGSELNGYSYLMASNSSIDFGSRTNNNSFVFTLAYFDADTNVQIQPNTVYTTFLVNYRSYLWDVSNAFRLSLTYSPVGTDSGPSSSTLSSGAIAGIVIAVVVVALVLVLLVVWLMRRSGSSPSWSNKSASETLQWSSRAGAASSSDEYIGVEMR